MIALIKFAMRALMPRSEGLPGVADTDLDGFLHRMRAETTPLLWAGIVAGALVFVFSPILTLGVPLPAFALPASWLDKHALRVVGHPLYIVRQAVLLLRLAAGMCWGSDPTVRGCFALAPYPPDPGTYRHSS